MINFSAISSETRLGRALRSFLCLVPNRAVIPILQGPLRGKKWIAGSSIHSCWLGNYEAAEAALIASTVRSKSIFFDIGAQAGYHTLLSSKLVGPQGKVFAFEPAAANAENLRRHLTLNRLTNVTVIESAVSNIDGAVAFDSGSNPVSGHVSASGTHVVRVLTLDREIEMGALPEPDFIKIDVEGEEARVLEGASKLLQRRHPTLYIETHQWMACHAATNSDCRRLLADLGYIMREEDISALNSSYHIFASTSSAPTG